jgi:hypothetical protein
MREKKLFRVTVEFDFYAYAEDQYDAMDMARDAADDFNLDDCAIYEEVKTQPRYLSDGWTRDSLVYDSDSGDIELGTLLDKLPKEGER